MLLTKLGFLQSDQQHTLIKISENNKSAHAIHQDLKFKQGGKRESESKGNKHPIVIHLKGDNQGSIALAHNRVFYSRTKHIDIQHNYICDEVASKKIDLSYVPTDQMIADGFTKALTHVKFHGFIEQMEMA